MLQGDCVEKCYVKLPTVTSIRAVKCILPLPFDSPTYNMHHATFCNTAVLVWQLTSLHAHVTFQKQSTMHRLTSHFCTNIQGALFLFSY